MSISELPNKRELVFYKRYLELGACYDDNTFLRCVMYPDECFTTKGEKFVPHVQNSVIINQCNPNDHKIGRCLKENTCALRSSDCAEDISQPNFRSDDEFCTHQRDKSIAWNVDEPAFTQFGSCRNNLTNDYFCIYDPDECVVSNNEVYMTPAETKAAGITCDCSEVHVTACITDYNAVMCAVKKDACEPSYPIKLNPHEQRLDRESGADELDCRLCKKTNTIKPTPYPTKFGSTANDVLKETTNLPTPAPVTINLTGVPDNSVTNPKSNIPMIIGVSAGGAAVLGVLIFALMKMGLFKKNAGKEYDTGPANLEISF